MIPILSGIVLRKIAISGIILFGTWWGITQSSKIVKKTEPKPKIPKAPLPKSEKVKENNIKIVEKVKRDISSSSDISSSNKTFQKTTEKPEVTQEKPQEEANLVKSEGTVKDEVRESQT